MRFGMRLVQIRRKLIANVLGKPQLDCDEQPSLSSVMRELETHHLSMDDLWADASMEDVLVYLRGSKALRIPDGFRDFIPSKIMLE